MCVKIKSNNNDRGVYIRNKENGILWAEVTSSIDYEYEETDILIDSVGDTNENGLQV